VATDGEFVRDRLSFVGESAPVGASEEISVFMDLGAGYLPNFFFLL